MPVAASTLDIPSPTGTPGFGWHVTVLPNGNIVINDPLAGLNGSGAIHLYRPDGTRISTLTGSQRYDYVGQDPVIVLPDGNFLVASYGWNNGNAEHAGAVTWVSATEGLDGEISATNSIVGTQADDGVGNDIVVLANGNYVVASESWHNGTVENAGAVTFARSDGTTHGVVSAANSLVGTSAEDYVGYDVVALANGNYLVVSPFWNNGALATAGAITWGNGETGITGAVSAANSLVGSASDDRLGLDDFYYVQVWPLANGNAVVLSPKWDNGALANAGAATWIDGSTGAAGPLSAANSLVGTTAEDAVGGAGYGAFADLKNGRYAILSPAWHRGDVSRAGAITWADAATGITGPVTTSNSLVGSTLGDLLGAHVTLLANGNAVVGSPNWQNDINVDAGAVTWIDGSAPRVGEISPENSLVGSSGSDSVGYGIVALANGNYVVVSPFWQNANVPNSGAVTWMDGTRQGAGVVSTANSLYGVSANDLVGHSTGGTGGVVALDNGNYIVLSEYWNDGAVAQAGAITWGDGATGTVGAVSPSNSLVGDVAFDGVGNEAHVLHGGNAVVVNYNWHGVGAVTWIDGTHGLGGLVSSANSLVGNMPGDNVGTVTVLNGNGNYMIGASQWSNGPHYAAGAAVWGNARTGIVGDISMYNARVGTDDYEEVGETVTAVGNGHAVITNLGMTTIGSVTLARGTSALTGTLTTDDTVFSPVGGAAMSFDYDARHDRLVVGWNGPMVTVFQAELLFKDSFD
ncbi:MAG TPA: hypothetical protein VKB52_07255 [Rhodanobacteraceae bacterium]|nr:hypothetical protein [Rhodanobacteraceae bacterium]